MLQTGRVCCHIVARVRVNVAVVVDVNSDAGAFGNLQVPRPRFVADATNARRDRSRGIFFFVFHFFPLFFLCACETRAPNVYLAFTIPPDISSRCSPHLSSRVRFQFSACALRLCVKIAKNLKSIFFIITTGKLIDIHTIYRAYLEIILQL